MIRLCRLVSYRRELRRNNYDAIYTNGQGNSILFVKQLLGKQKNWVHHHHTSGDSLDQANWSPKYVEALQQADRVIACSHTNSKNISSALNRKIDPIYCFSRAIEVKNRTRVNGNKIRLGYFGRLIKEKGISTICKMSEEEEFHNTAFHIWGSPSTYDEYFFKQYPNIHYHGKFEGIEGLKKALSELDGFLLLSTHSEGLPISLLEVTSSGTPWLATDKGGILDIAFDASSTRVISSNTSYPKIKKTVLKFVTDIKNGEISTEGLKEFYKEKFSATTLLNQWFSILNLKF